MRFKEELGQIRSRLHSMMAVVHPDVRSDLERLFEIASFAVEPAFIDAFTQWTAQAKELLASCPAPEAPPAEDASTAEPVDGSDDPSPVPEADASVINLKHLPLSEKDQIRLELLEASVNGKDEAARQASLDRKIEEIGDRYGLLDAEQRAFVVTGMLSRARGKRRSEYVARMLLSESSFAQRQVMLTRLSRAYGVSQRQLQKEAKRHPFWQRATQTASRAKSSSSGKSSTEEPAPPSPDYFIFFDGVSEKDRARLELLAAQHQGAEALEAKREELIGRLNLDQDPNAQFRLSRIYANTQGKSRGDFIARVLRSIADPDQRETCLAHLSRYYGTDAAILVEEASESSKRDSSTDAAVRPRRNKRSYARHSPDKLRTLLEEMTVYDTARYELLVAHTEGLEAYAAARDRWVKTLNLGQVTHRGGLLNSLLASSRSASHRCHFTARVLQRASGKERTALLGELARCYGIKPAELLALAKSSYWWLEAQTENAS